MNSGNTPNVSQVRTRRFAQPSGAIVMGPNQCESYLARPIAPWGWQCYSNADLQPEVRGYHSAAPRGTYVTSLHRCANGPQGIRHYDGYICL